LKQQTPEKQMNELKEKITEWHLNNLGASEPGYAKLGTDYQTGHAAYIELLEAGILKIAKVPSKSGKRMMNRIVHHTFK
jgi:hypothetical protein